MRGLLPITFLVLIQLGCRPVKTSDHVTGLKPGAWRLVLELSGANAPQKTELPVLFDVAVDSLGTRIIIHNAEESITVRDIDLSGDSIRIRMPLFDSEFIGVLQGDSAFRGHWHNHLKGSGYTIPFIARASTGARFQTISSGSWDPSGEWETWFSPGSSDSYPALGLFHALSNGVSATFCTETGDYRYLEGVASGDSLQLSSFDGSHAFLFSAQLDGDTLRGRYWSGNHWQEPFVAWRNADFELRDPDSLTTLKEGYEMVDFSFPDLDGKQVSPKDDRFKDKVLMVQVMGSWCPNCVDETVLLNEMFQEYHGKGLEVLALAFERYEQPERAVQALRAFKKNLDVRYDILYAGESKKELAAEKLPFLSRIMSYPTCIFIDRSGKVRRIRTGFYGPSTGAHYENYVRNLRSFMETLLAEENGDVALKR